MKKILAKLCSICLLLIIFASLLLCLILGGPVPEGKMPMLGFGLLSYSCAVFAILISSRPKIIAQYAGVGFIYGIHGVAGALLVVTGIIHGAMGFMDQLDYGSKAWVTPTGIAAIFLFLFVVLVGALALSGKIKMKKRMKREAGLIVHRFSMLAIILVYGHMMGITFLSNHTALKVVGGVYLALAIIAFIAHMVKGRVSRKHTVIKAEKVNADVHRIVLSPNRRELPYGAGQYAFFRFVSSSLPKESHPFSIVSTGKDVELLIKESGDFTRRLDEAKVGDIVAIDGPYGNFFSEEKIRDDKPMVLLAGGIGITPFLGLLRYMKEKSIKKECHLLWGVKSADDAFLIGELEEIKNALPSFSYSIAYSKESKDGKTKRVDLAFMKENGIDSLFPNADFYICGPAAFNASLKGTLKENGVDKKRITLEEFSF